jgi:hypothetical protein
MFNLTIVDHVRLSFGHVVQNYTLHVQAAERARTFLLYARIAILTSLAAATGSGIAALYGGGRAAVVAATAGSALAFTLYAIVTALAPQDRVTRHRHRANRLWLLCERYRALLAEIHDGLLDRDRIMARRDALVQEFHDIYAQGAPADDAAAPAKGGSPRAPRPLTDEQIDQFLPQSLRKPPAGQESAASAG